MSTTLRRTFLKLLKAVRITEYRSKSSLGLPYIVHLGDALSENLFYAPFIDRAELHVMGAWCQGIERPVIYDIGGNTGYIATQLAQLLRDQQPHIFSFEPIPATFQKLMSSIRALGLEEIISPICCAVSEQAGLLQISYSEWNSMLAQVLSSGGSERAGGQVIWVNALTLQAILDSTQSYPHLIKIDVEGHELSVVRSAKTLFRSEGAPALLVEFNPDILGEANYTPDDFAQAFPHHSLHYISNVSFHHNPELPFGAEAKECLARLRYPTNLFAVPHVQQAQQRWEQLVAHYRPA